MFFYNWNLTRPQQQDTIESQVENENTIYISLLNLFILPFTHATAYYPCQSQRDALDTKPNNTSTDLFRSVITIT